MTSKVVYSSLAFGEGWGEAVDAVCIILPGKEWFDEPGDHADELETSVMMHYHPELVNLSEAGPGCANPFALQSLREKTAWLPRHWTRVTSDSGIGNPHLASDQKGRRFAEAVAQKYAVLLKELAAVNDEQDFYLRK